jgi:hypothetical protein
MKRILSVGVTESKGADPTFAVGSDNRQGVAAPPESRPGFDGDFALAQPGAPRCNRQVGRRAV